MSPADWHGLSSSEVDVERLTLLLGREGWTRSGGQPGRYGRWTLTGPADAPEQTLLVPLDAARGDYAELLTEVLGELKYLAGIGRPPAVRVLNALAAPGDELRFTKSVPTVRGAVPWGTGEEVFAAARATLVAGAKARLSRRAYFGNAHGRFANRFLDDVLMGQTDVGSFVVAAFSRPERVFPERDSPTAPLVAGVGTYTGRDITTSIATALQAVNAALADYRRDDRLEVFDESVREGVSRELSDAVRTLVTGSDGAEVSIDWAPSPQMALLEEPSPPPLRIEFSPSDAPILERVATRLAASEPTEYVRVLGWVNVVARPERGQPGVVRVRVVSGSEARSVQVRLSEEQFEVAASAIAHEQGIVVSGRQEREGNRYWLYHASNLGVVELPERRARRGEPGPGQGTLGTDETD
jgi:hypothetical protein